MRLTVVATAEAGHPMTHETILAKNVDLLGQLLGQVVRASESDLIYQKVEAIRFAAKQAREQREPSFYKLVESLTDLTDDELLPITKAFNQFLNLVNIADDHYTIATFCEAQDYRATSLDKLFQQVLKTSNDKSQLEEAVKSLSIELVLTAHPTEIIRRTLIAKYAAIEKALEDLDRCSATKRCRVQVKQTLKRLITEIWETDTFRQQKPTPIDETIGCMAVVETALWAAVPEFCREMDATLRFYELSALPLDAVPVRFVSWMGGDRDGNPNVTAEVTAQVIAIHQWKLAELYLKDIDALITELSMSSSTASFCEYAGTDYEPYRQVLRALRSLLRDTFDFSDRLLKGEPVVHTSPLRTVDQLLEPLMRCYHALKDSHLSVIANGLLTDTIRRVHCFGVHLLKLDVRQESSRHAACLSEITQYLGMDDYLSWPESQKEAFLIEELSNKRPLLSAETVLSAEAREVIETCRVIASQPLDAFGAYVISMAKAPSDILAVELLLKEAGCRRQPPIVPLFETLDDLNHAPAVMKKLFELRGKRQKKEQMVMIGYSDSSKDAGFFAAGWAQYQAQEALIALCEEQGIKLTLFHGRGGTVGRGGDPAHAALLSQPPGSLEGGLRVTVQGEMIRNKLGLPSIAHKTFERYASAMLQAGLEAPPYPGEQWRKLADQLASDSCETYRQVVRQDSAFIDYFQQATPIRELSVLPVGSRPARRKQSGGIENLRAIPWIFSWSQNRLMLPAWLGFGEAISAVLAEGEEAALLSMYNDWPFFSTRISLVEMVFTKADMAVSAYYDRSLVEPKLQAKGKVLRDKYRHDAKVILSLSGGEDFMEDARDSRHSFALRQPYLDPLNLLQVELLQRLRISQDENLHSALMVTIAGIAAGLRNTG